MWCWLYPSCIKTKQRHKSNIFIIICSATHAASAHLPQRSLALFRRCFITAARPHQRGSNFAGRHFSAPGWHYYFSVLEYGSGRDTSMTAY
jgi:hypothetical protein